MANDPLSIYVGNAELGTDKAQQPPGKVRQLRDVINDAFAFIRSYEANQAFATVTIEQLMNDQIARNGESGDSYSAKYDPYTYDPAKTQPASQTPTGLSNNLSGSDTERPTRYDRITAIMNNIQAVVDDIKKTPPVAVASASEYTLETQASLDSQDEE